MLSLRLALALALLAVLAPPALAQPNVVVFMTDDQALSSVPYMPNVQNLAASGTTFEHHLATFPLCCPARATLLTGQYAHNHGVLHNAGPFGGYQRLDHTLTLPVWLQQVGYRTLQVGRWLNNYGVGDSDQTLVPPGWDEWFVPVGSSARTYVGQTINENGLLRYPTAYQTDLYARKAIELLRETTSPFLLQVTFSAPHAGHPADPDDPPSMRTPSPAPRYQGAMAGVPLPSPPSFDERSVSDKPAALQAFPRLDSAARDGIRENWEQELESLLSVDEAIGRVVEELRASGMLDDTLILFTSDNGYMHGEHRIPAGKVWPYEESTRVPLVMRGPGVPEGLRLPQLTGNVDVVPTILEAAGATSGAVSVDGRSLFGLMRDPTREWGRDILLQSAFGANNVGGYAGLRNPRFLYVEWKRSRERELYDLDRDPYQLRNLAGTPAYTTIQAQLRGRLATLRGCYGRGCSRPPRLRLRSARRCVLDSRAVRVEGGALPRVGTVDFLEDGRLVARDRRVPFALAVPGGRTVRVRAELDFGGVLTLDRRTSPCP